MIFNVTTGAIMIGGKYLRGDMSLNDLISEGFTFSRVFDMQNGWVHRTAKQDMLGTHAVTPSLGFNNERLDRVSFSFLETDDFLQSSLLDRHKYFLFQKIGTPTSSKESQVLYAYSWGQITAECDPRSGTSYIIIVWHK